MKRPGGLLFGYFLLAGQEKVTRPRCGEPQVVFESRAKRARLFRLDSRLRGNDAPSRQHLLNRPIRQLIGALVLLMSAMPLDPLPVNLVLVRRFVKALPQILVLHRFLVRGFPTAAFPVGEPFGDAFFHVLGIGRERDLARTLERFERLDRGHEFHAVVGGLALGAVEFLLVIVLEQDRAPAPGSGIATASAVSEDRDFIQVTC